MTLHQLFLNGVTTVTRKEWKDNPYAFMKISGTPDGLLHPWGEVHDVNDFCKKILIVEDSTDDWKQY